MNLRTPLLTALIYLPALSGISPSQTPGPPAWSFLEDADQDGMTDVNEILLSLDPLNPADGLSDLDGDGLSLSWEFAIGTHASLADSDADGWSDSEEYLTHGTDPRDWLSFPVSSSSPSTAPPAAAPLPAPAAPTPTPTPPPPSSLSNGDFNVETFTWKSGQNFKDYQGRGFDWGQGAVGSVKGWSAYIGTTVEVWKSGTETFVELDGTSTSHGIKQDISNVVPGPYVLAWKQCGRTNNLAEDNAYKVKIYYTIGTGTSEKPVTISETAEFKAIDKTKWTDNSHSFQITANHIAAANGNQITVAFIPTGTLNTYGTLIDKVSFAPVDLILDNNNIAYKPATEALGVSNYVTTDGIPSDSQFADVLDDPKNFRLQARLPNSTTNSIVMKLEVKRGGAVISTTNYTLDKKDGNFVRCRFLRLVTDNNDNTASDAGSQSDPNNQTILVKLGDQIKVSYEIVAGKKLEQEIHVGRPQSEDNNDLPKPWKHDIREVKVRFTVAKNTLGSACVSDSQLNQIVNDANERLAQTGIRIKRTPENTNVIEAPSSPQSSNTAAYLFSGTFTISTTSQISNPNPDEREFAKLKDNDANTVDVFYVPFIAPANVRASAYRAGRNNTGNTIYNNWIVVSADMAAQGAPNTLPHELMHILLNEGHRKDGISPKDPITALFRQATSQTKDVSGSKRIGPYTDATAAGSGEADTTTMRANAETLP